MDAKDHLVNDVLRENRRYMVPLYQRQYQWGQDQLRPFWDDVQAKADAVLENTARFPHYLGALILAPGGDGYTLATPRVQVVDGQQRLTTFLIFLTALREVAVAHGLSDISEQVGDYLLNPKKAADTDPLARYKLMPTPPDRVFFHALVDERRWELRTLFKEHFYQNGNLRWGNAPTSLYAFEYFVERIETYALHGSADEEDDEGHAIAEGAGDPSKREVRIGALLEALLNRMKLVVITLDEGDDAQVIFETLNSKGKELQAMDLVRNNIFHRAEAEGSEVEALYEKLWQPFDDLWWREPAPRARPRLPRIDHFLAHVLTSHTGQATSMRELYAEYRAYSRPKGVARFEKVHDELQLLTRYAPTYETLEGRRTNDEHIFWLGRKLAVWEMSSAYPLAFVIAEPGVTDDSRRTIARLVYSLIVRRALCGLSTKSLNTAFRRIADHLRKEGATVATFANAINQLTTDATRFPSDADLVAAIRSNPVYKWIGSGRLQDILWELDKASRSAFAEKLTLPENLSVEHVLPQGWDAAWPFSDGSCSSHDAGTTEALNRNRTLDSLGNLTLVTGELNSSLSNTEFSTKRDKLDSHTHLALNSWIRKRAKWDEEEIIERADYLSKLALQTWPSPSVL